MRISTLSIGSELISGEVTDTNAGRIAELLLGCGLRVLRHMVVGDSEPDIGEALNELALKSDAVIVTGGLGPTVDDVTALAAAHATGRRLVVNEELKEHIRSFTAKLGGGHASDRQAMIPTKSTIIPNPTGTACGFHFIHGGCFFFFLPGVPSEMEPMLGDTVLPFLCERVMHKKVILSSFQNVYGLSEPEVDGLLKGAFSGNHAVQMSICVTFPWIRVTLRVDGDTETAARTRLQDAVELVRERLGAAIFSEGHETMEQVVAGLFGRRGLTLALAESCTGGLIAKRLTDVPGSSAFFLEGAVTYSNAAKQRLLGVPQVVLETRGAVSSECAAAMATGARAAAGSDLGLAVTGIAGPDGGTADKPVGTVFISLAAPDGCWTRGFRFGGNREDVRTLTAWTALDWVRRYLADGSPFPV
ncbi:competence/damage-inducible protein A [Oryzomonas sagensis]|uniref:CinA-like protein n=1 Tax=Oryzomonas sagensis TaxID=2603857 RepID=A0ABQ6TSU2_9BACT|nr:competence/damage-inducible protein A [Oryzomonas sagensis]KAB0672020.1 competence/damage-inducible protein A [Oryzomonas sagensis]